MIFLMYAEWLAGTLMQAYLVALMKRNGAHREFPWFYRLLVFEVGKAPILFFLFRLHRPGWYFTAFWVCQLIGYMFQLGTIADLFALTCRVRDTALLERCRYAVYVSGPAICSILAVDLGDQAAGRDYLVLLGSWIGRLFATVFCLLFLLIAMNARKFSYNQRLIGIASGFGISAGAQLLLAAMMGVFGFSQVWYAHLFRGTYFVAMSVWFECLRQPALQPATREEMEQVKGLLVDVKG